MPPVFDDRDFQTRFLVRRSVLLRIDLAFKDESFFQQCINATGLQQAHPLKTVVAAFRVIAYGKAADRSDDYVRVSRSTVARATKLLLEFILRRWKSTYLRRPSQSELKQTMEPNAKRGFPGCVDSLDCIH